MKRFSIRSLYENRWVIIGLGLFFGVLGLFVWKFEVINQMYRDEVHREGQNWVTRNAQMKEISESQKNLAQQVRQFAGSGQCEDDGDCAAAGLGAKTCDGYLNFFYYSTRTFDEERFFAAVREFNRNQETLSRQSYQSPACGVKLPPPPACIKGYCAKKGP